METVDGSTEPVWSGNPKKAARRKRIVRWIPSLLTACIRLLSASLRFRVHVPAPTRRFFRTGRPFILAFWHGRMLILAQVFRSQFPEPSEFWNLISQHWDGEIIARTVRPFGVRSIRGSSTRGGRLAFQEMCDRIAAGDIVGITPDGPKGPRFRVVQKGVLRLARETGAPIVPVAWSARPRIRMRSWDRFQIPLPFSRVFAAYGDPLWLDPEEPIEDQRDVLENRINSLTHETGKQALDAGTAAWFARAYSLFLLLLCIPLAPFLYWKFIRGKGGWGRLRQRMGLYGPQSRTGKGGRTPLWVHASSVGEVSLTASLLQGLKMRDPDRPWVVTTFTDTGQALARDWFEGKGRVLLFPFDFRLTVGSALRRIRPKIFLQMETEIWPNFLFALGRKGVPAALLNGRISLKSVRRYGWFRSFFRLALGNIRVFAMQSRTDACRIIRLGADPRRVFVTGNMKYDIPVSLDPIDGTQAVRGEFGFDDQDLVFVAGSTHDGEEEILLEVYLRLRERLSPLKMLLAPRHPERCDEILCRIAGLGISTTKRTSCPEPNPDDNIEVLLLDTIGELARAYSAGNVVFVGGSLVPVGGHNLLEPVLFRKPVLFGPHTENFVEIAETLKGSGGGIEVRDGEEFYEKALRLFEDPERRREAGRAAFQILEQNRGAVERNIDLVLPLMDDE